MKKSIVRKGLFFAVVMALQIHTMPVSAGLQKYQNQIDEVVMLINQERAAQGLAPLQEAAALNDAANIRANELTTYYNHKRPDGAKCFTVLVENGIDYMAAGENIAYGFATPEDVMSAWMASTEGHRENILSEDFDAVGVGVAYVNGVYYWEQMFTGESGLSPLYTIGNFNGDEEPNAKDAGTLLINAAAIGAGNAPVLNELQLSYADINGDSRADSADSAMLLEYAAYRGAGGSDTLETYFHLS